MTRLLTAIVLAVLFACTALGEATDPPAGPERQLAQDYEIGRFSVIGTGFTRGQAEQSARTNLAKGLRVYGAVSHQILSNETTELSRENWLCEIRVEYKRRR